MCEAPETSKLNKKLRQPEWGDRERRSDRSAVLQLDSRTIKLQHSIDPHPGKLGYICNVEVSCDLAKFMESHVSFLTKVLFLSALISVAIKLLGPTIAIAATPTNAWVLVLLPTGVMATLLGWRAWQQRSLN